MLKQLVIMTTFIGTSAVATENIDIQLSQDIATCFKAKAQRGDTMDILSIKKIGNCTCSEIGVVSVNDMLQQGPYYEFGAPLFKGYTRNISYPNNDPKFQRTNQTFRVNCLNKESVRF